jgi:hypothetical protein
MSKDPTGLVAAGLADMVNGQMQISPAGALALALKRAFDVDAAEDERARSLASVSTLLDGARRRGFANTGILLALAASGSGVRCFAALAQAAMDRASPGEVSAAIGLVQQSISAVGRKHPGATGGM